ncbi:hypothetical protein [Thiorhodovibrio frisius]|uniref:Glycosyltransferase RgtA/B/C/D-like domain-containing protein n=1 Tax=Thiorhodovibrio frisius TaxID=631362 RepID=H8Z644_9GAMM|nr:hypothetical protein [Thiorhodovibrio frisius]EIC19611.1 hypothetical protein Thi970DRAFT_03195 [Thiorhodovibrio frisius]WPL20424.1 hypothetical protein Thiofri_00520 [Thiorhodovibrio frisius]
MIKALFYINLEQIFAMNRSAANDNFVWTLSIWLLSTVLMAIALLSTYMATEANSALFGHSDLIQPYMLARDILANPAAILDWYHSPALYVFPDWLLAMILVAWVPGSDRVLPLLYSVILLLAYSIAGSWLLRQSLNTSLLRGTWLLVTISVVSACVTHHDLTTPMTTWLFLTGSTAYIHTGALVLTLVAGGLLMRCLQRPSATGTAIMALIGAITTFSDALFMVWFVAPACVVLLLHAWAQRSGPPLITIAWISGAGLIAMLVEHLLRSTKPELHRIEPSKSLQVFISDLQAVVSAGDVGFMLMLVAIMVIALRAAIMILRLLRRQTLTPAAYLELFLAGSISAALLAPLALGVYWDLTLWRYLLVIPVLVIIWVVHCVLKLSPQWQYGLTTGAIITTLGLGTVSISSAWEHIQSLQQPIALEQCLREQGRDTGFGDYWNAKRLLFLSDRRLHIIQINAVGQPFHMNYNRRWFAERADTGAPVQPDFVILDRLDAGVIARRFGSPKQVIHCDGSAIWLYPRR